MSAEEDGTMRVWLDTAVKEGYGGKFASSFEECGVEDEADLADVDDEVMELLVAELKAAGAKALHLKKIQAAIAEAVNKQKPTRDALNAAATTALAASADDAAPVRTSTRKYASFLSHHKASCAMEARYLKVELEKVLGAPVFLDSDGEDRYRWGTHILPPPHHPSPSLSNLTRQICGTSGCSLSTFETQTFW